MFVAIFIKALNPKPVASLGFKVFASRVSGLGFGV